MKQQLKRLNAPKTWVLHRKERTWIQKPRAGPHSVETSLTLNFIIKDLLRYAKTTGEVKKITNEGKIMVDKKVRKDLKFPVGLMDIVEIPEMKESFRVLINKKGQLFLNKADNAELNIKPCKIIGKTILKGGKTQLNLYDSKNLLVDKGDYKVGDTVVIDLTNNKIKEHLPLKKGNTVLLTEGKYVGEMAILEEIHKFKGTARDKITLKLNDKTIETAKDYAFVIGKDKPVVNFK